MTAMEASMPIQPNPKMTSPMPTRSPIHMAAAVVMTPSATSPNMRVIASV